MTIIEWPRRVAAVGQFHVRDLGSPELDSDDDHHLRKVLRAREGEEIVVTDGRGSWALCAVTERGLELVTHVHLDPASPETTLYLSPLKGDRAEWAVAKATEVGVTRVVPLISERMVVKFKGDAREKTLSRWRRIAAEATGQCRRTYDVEIAAPVRVGDVPAWVAIADFGAKGNWQGVRGVAIGPEGGWAANEWDETRRRVGLGPTVLRAETAGVVAAAIVAFQAGGWGFALDGTQNE
ncbi:MAG TPA: RsmE family RNA methyltransferase [Acidimicrobiales bacterium]|nr:RsmE family RNA methyltransferase [Acidimicrobiales bacterium]